MPDHIAHYTISAYQFDSGVWMPDPDTHNKTHRFSADTAAAARAEAREYKATIAHEFFGADVTLTDLHEVQDVLEGE